MPYSSRRSFPVPYVVYRAFGLERDRAGALSGNPGAGDAGSFLPPSLPEQWGRRKGICGGLCSDLWGGTGDPAMLVSRGISFYAFLIISGAVALAFSSDGAKGRDRTQPFAFR